jgi:hypothetical protein
MSPSLHLLHGSKMGMRSLLTVPYFHAPASQTVISITAFGPLQCQSLTTESEEIGEQDGKLNKRT